MILKARVYGRLTGSARRGGVLPGFEHRSPETAQGGSGLYPFSSGIKE